MSNQKSPRIEFFNRRTGQVEVEQIYGEKPLRFAYQNPCGRLALELFVKRPFFSAWYGRRMEAPSSKNRIAPFIEKYGLEPADFLDPVDSFASFNAFFYRKLKPQARPVCSDPSQVVFPADGRHLGLQNLTTADSVFVKGQRFDLLALLGDAALAKRFQGGSLILSRLCPVDYHRFHFPVSGTPVCTRLINGSLYSVNPIALCRNLGYLWQNKRALTLLETENVGTVALLEIGATNVGSIQQTYASGQRVAKGVEKGYFAFGGSSTITIFEPGRVRLAGDLLEQSANCRELYAWMGDAAATIC